MTEEAGGRPADAPGAGLKRLLAPRLRRVDVAVAALLAVLGFAAAVQVRSTSSEGPLSTARQEDLVQILDELRNRNSRLRAEVNALEQSQRELTSGDGATGAALAEARRRAQLLGVLAGTVAARGPGLSLTVTDPDAQITADVLLDTLEELRAAGAEAVQLEGPASPGQPGDGAPTAVRVVASTAFADTVGEPGVLVDGRRLLPPYRFTVVGDPDTIEPALGIPGGVVDNVASRGGQAIVRRDQESVVDALQPLREPRYARPAR